MLRILYSTPTDEQPDEIAERNIKLSLDNHNMETLNKSSIGWLKNDSSRTFQDLETYYRLNKFNAYLIAISKIPDDIKNDPKLYLKTHNNEMNTDDLKYICEIVIEPFEKALELILKQHESYEENFNALKYSGHIASDDENYIKETEVSKKLMKNEILLEFKSLTAKESIETMSNDILYLTGQKPTIHIVGKYDSESPIMAFKNDKGELQSHIGWIIRKVNNELTYDLIDLNEHFYK
jgi:hypothetical protein